MASSGVNVLRWSALAVGVFYGFSHSRSIKAREQQAHADAEWAHKESLISQAKAQWAKEHPQATQKTSSGARADPQDPNADYLAVLGITDEK